jgi:uncharacterized protein YjcR
MGCYDIQYLLWNKLNYPQSDIDRFWKYVDIKYDNDKLDFESCWELKRGDVKGYPAFWFNGRNYVGSRFSYECFYGNIKPNMVICHTCDNPKCVNPYHLWEGTTQDNNVDRDVKNRTAKGSNIYTSKLTEDDIVIILSKIKYNEYRKVVDIAEDYNVSCVEIYRILNGNMWKDITSDICINQLECTLLELKNKITNIENNDNVKLTKNQVLNIIDLINSGMSYNEISQLYNISISTICYIKTGKLWASVTGIKKTLNGPHKGSDHKNAKLTEQDVLNIRHLLTIGYTGRELAELYNVKPMAISRIKNRQSWKHI